MSVASIHRQARADRVAFVHLGFEVGSGKSVEIPLRNTVVTGQTQESGKTTTLEAMVERSQIKAIAFVTKRGEGGFVRGRRIAPYFRERTDWEFVAGILEAERREKLKIERAWIIRACKGARTLEEVHRNVRAGMGEARRGMDRDMFEVLNAYLDNVIPQMRQFTFAPAVDLEAGVNVMDLAGMTQELQQLVIASTMQWVYLKENAVVTILPEAWEFAPQGRRSPAKLAAAELVRKGSGLKDFLWLDSQDIAGVEKELLRSCPVWLLGVQREANEIKRTLANIPAGVDKPSAADIATLERGQFFACWGKHAIRTYVQPAWLDGEKAQAVATGALSIDDISRFKPSDRAGRGRRQAHREVTSTAPAPPPSAPRNQRQESEDEPMSKEDVDMLGQKIDSGFSGLAKQLGGLAGLAQRVNAETAAERASPAVGAGGNGSIDEDALYQRFKSRLMREAPALIKVMADKPELHVEHRRQVIELDTSTPKGALGKLIAEGWFDETNGAYAAYVELVRRGVKMAKVAVYRFCDEFTAAGILTKEKKGSYKTVPGAVTRIKESK